MIEEVKNGEKILAIIIRSDFDKKGIEFMTPHEYSQQMAYMHHEKDYVIEPHFHNIVERTVQYTQEVLIIKEGIIQVDFYDENCFLIDNRRLYAEDIILLCSGGHGFKIIEEVKMVEIKQGPYVGEADKTRFQPNKKD